MDRWEDAEGVLIEDAVRALRAHGEVEPALVAFAGANLRFVAWLRPFEPGAYYDPMVELLSLAAPLDCDRLMVSFGGRLWSPESGPPVDEDGDHRQRAIVLHAVDGAEGSPRARSVLQPFRVEPGGDVVLEPRWDPGPPTSGVADLLVAAVRGRARMRVPWSEIVAQAGRVDALGHHLFVPPDVMTLLLDAAVAEP